MAANKVMVVRVEDDSEDFTATAENGEKYLIVPCFWASTTTATFEAKMKEITLGIHKELAACESDEARVKLVVERVEKKGSHCLMFHFPFGKDKVEACEEKRRNGDSNNWDYSYVQQNGYHAMLLQNAATHHPANSTWDDIQRLPVEGLDDPVRDEELYSLYAYTKFLAMAQFGGSGQHSNQGDCDDGATSDQFPGHGGWADGTGKPGKFPGHGGSAVSASQQGGSSSSTSGGGPSPANHP